MLVWMRVRCFSDSSVLKNPGSWGVFVFVYSSSPLLVPKTVVARTAFAMLVASFWMVRMRDGLWHAVMVR